MRDGRRDDTSEFANPQEDARNKPQAFKFGQGPRDGRATAQEKEMLVCPLVLACHAETDEEGHKGTLAYQHLGGTCLKTIRRWGSTLDVCENPHPTHAARLWPRGGR